MEPVRLVRTVSNDSVDVVGRLAPFEPQHQRAAAIDGDLDEQGALRQVGAEALQCLDQPLAGQQLRHGNLLPGDAQPVF